MKVDVRDSDTTPGRRSSRSRCRRDELAEDYNAILEDYQKRAVLPGFRKAACLGTSWTSSGTPWSTRSWSGRSNAPTSAPAGSRSLEPVSYPAIDKIRFDKGKPLTCEAKVDVRPSVTPRDYWFGHSGERGSPSGTTRSTRPWRSLPATAEWVPVERDAALGDAVLVDYVRLNAKGSRFTKSEQKDALVELTPRGRYRSFAEPPGQEDGR